jgi:hypothetical protein
MYIRGRCSKQATNGSKTAVMDVIGYLCVSLGSSTVQLRHNLGSACACSMAGFSSQNGNRAWGYTTEEQRSVVRFLWAKGLNAKDIHKEMFLIYGGKCMLRKAVHNWVKEFSEWRSKFADDAPSGAEMAETTVENTSVLRVSTHW